MSDDKNKLGQQAREDKTKRPGVKSERRDIKKNKNKNKKGNFIILVDENKKYSTGQGGIERDANNNPYRYSYDADPMLKDKNVAFIKPMAKGGRAGYKSGMRVCKLAKRGKGKAYGKNS